jgi:NDP-sugar pyrophosphorylase family protein
LISKNYWDWHWRGGGASMVLVRVQATADTVRSGWAQLQCDFAEKKTAPKWINAGIYLLGQDVLQSIPGRCV